MKATSERRRTRSEHSENVLEATGEKIADAAGFVADKSEDAAGEAGDKAEDVKTRPSGEKTVEARRPWAKRR